MNVFEATVRGEGDRLCLHLGGGVSLDYAQNEFFQPVREAILGRQQVVIGVRPHAVERSATGVPAVVAVNQWLGDQSHIAADFGGASIVLVEHDRADVKPGDAININLDPSRLHMFDATSGNAVAHGPDLVA